MTERSVSPDPELGEHGGDRAGALLFAFVLAGAALSTCLGVYARVHTPTHEAISTFGFPTLVDMKVWVATAGLAFGVVQVLTALRMYGRIGSGPSSKAVGITHRMSGVIAVLLTLPVAFNCLWALGFSGSSPRALLHSVVGCAFYGVFLTKMLVLRSGRGPSWVLPVLGGTLFTLLVTVWLTSSLWWWTTH